jgi:hypothetical protein
MKSRLSISIFSIVACALLLQQVCEAQSKFLRKFSLSSASAPTSSVPPSNSISQSVIDSQVLWIGTSKGVAKSSDLGRSWSSYRSNPAFHDDGIYALAANGNLIWAATGYDKETSDGTVQTGSGYSYSTDNGATWYHLGQTLDKRGDSIITYGINKSLLILPVTVPEQNVTFDIALTLNTVWIASWASGLRKSTDNGTTWQRIILPADNQSSISFNDTLWYFSNSDTLHLDTLYHKYDPRQNNNYLAFSVYVGNDMTIWCGTAGGVNRSTDGGNSWVKFSHQNEAEPILGNWVIAIGEQTYNGIDRIWTTNWKANDPDEDYGISYSDDSGATWKSVLRGVKAYDIAFKDSIVYIASDNGLYRSGDGGRSFNLITNITDPVNHQIVSRSTVYTVSVLGDTVIAGTSDGLAMTIDNNNNPFGEVWTVKRAFAQLGTSTSSYAYPNPFSPQFQVARIHYGKSAKANGNRTITVDIFDFNMNRVRTLINNAPRSSTSEYDEVWDGRSDNGTTAANGVYFYRIKIDDDDPLYGKILLLQ